MSEPADVDCIREVSGPVGTGYEGPFRVRIVIRAGQLPAVAFLEKMIHPLVDYGMITSEVFTPLKAPVTADTVVELISILLTRFPKSLAEIVCAADADPEEAARNLLARYSTIMLATRDAVAAWAPLRRDPSLYGPALPPGAVPDALAAALATPRGPARDAALRACLHDAAGPDGRGSVMWAELLTPAFCAALLAEVDAHAASGAPRPRPNSMNRYGVVVDEVGFAPLMRALQEAVLEPIAAVVFPEIAAVGPFGGAFTQRHAFVVEYKDGGDASLDMHTDDSDVTFNVCLGDVFSGSTLSFCGMLGTAEHRRHSLTYSHAVGRAVCHRGRQRHGADTLESGRRVNLVVWLVSQPWREARNATAPAWVADERVDPVCVSATHDVDYERHVGVRPPRPGAMMPWCPLPAGTLYR